MTRMTMWSVGARGGNEWVAAAAVGGMTAKVVTVAAMATEARQW